MSVKSNQVPPLPNRLKLFNAWRKIVTFFEYRNFGDFNFEIQLRNRVIEAAIALDKSGPEFSTLEESQSNQRYWHLSKDGTFTLQPGILPHAALVDIFMNGGLYAFECGTAIVVTFFKGDFGFNRPQEFRLSFFQTYFYMTGALQGIWLSSFTREGIIHQVIAFTSKTLITTWQPLNGKVKMPYY
ncbi:hypothetical protein RCO48_07445 [Peribacillus frigoritolerans]|nr:hypothetical protein [Peribacillus frigoritolerans]